MRFVYDALGDLRERTDQTGEKTKYDVDALGRVMTATYPDATTEIARYDWTTEAVSSTKKRAS